MEKEEVITITLPDYTVEIPRYLAFVSPYLINIPIEENKINWLDIAKRYEPIKPILLQAIKLLKLYITTEGEIKPIEEISDKDLDFFWSFESTQNIANIIGVLVALNIDDHILTLIKKKLIILQFPDDPSTNQNNFIYPLYDMQFFTTIHNMIEALGNEEAVIPIHNITKWQLEQSRHLVELFLVNGGISAQTHYIQRKRINDFLDDIDKINIRFLIDLALGLSYLDADTIITKQVCYEYAQRIKKIVTLTNDLTLSTQQNSLKEVPLTADLINGLSYENGIAHFFIDPLLQYLKGMISIINIKEIEKEEPVLSTIQEGIYLIDSPYAKLKGNIIDIHTTNNERYFYNLLNSTKFDHTNAKTGRNVVLNSTQTLCASESTLARVLIQNIDDPMQEKYIVDDDIKNFKVTDEDIIPTTYRFTPDDTKLIVGYNNGFLAVYNIEDQKTIAKEHSWGTASIISVVCHPYDDSMLLFTQKDKAGITYPSADKISIINLFGHIKIFNFEQPVQVCTATFTPDGEHILIAYVTTSNQLICDQYNAINFQQEFHRSHSIKPGTRHIKIDSNITRYLIQVRGTYQTIITGNIDSDTFKIWSEESIIISNDVFLYGDILKYMLRSFTGSDLYNFHLYSLQKYQGTHNILSFYHDPKWQTYLKFKIFSCFNKDQTRCVIRSSPTTLSTWQLYDDCWLQVFKYVQTAKFNIQELHTLYRKYIAIKHLSGPSGADILAELSREQKEGMKGINELIMMINNCLYPKKKEEEPETNIHKAGISPRVYALYNIIRNASSLFKPTYQMHLQPAAPTQIEEEEQALVQQPGRQIAPGPIAPGRVEIVQQKPAISQRIWQGLKTILTAPFKAVRYIWKNTFGRLFS
jgi:hypothetical protein